MRQEANDRAWLTMAVWVAVVPFAAWAVLRWTGWEPLFRWGQLVAFTPYVVGAGVLVPLVALVLRCWWAAGVAAMVAVSLVWAVLPRALPDGNPGVDGPVLRVAAANLLKGEAEIADVLKLVRETKTDVLALQELTPGAETALHKAGLKGLLPHAVVLAEPGVTGSAVYSRHPLRAKPVIKVGFAQARVEVNVPGAPPVEVVSVHPCAPSTASMADCWRDGLRALPRAERGGPVRVLAGDFNATLDHGLMRDLLDSGYRDAADVMGEGLRTTWPNLGSHASRTPPTTLDHVLADGRVAVQSFGVRAIRGTDHRAVFATLRLP
ncbi:endonuclease/exonuclease/phosphatase family protein [Spirillospora sp. CA-294931]|uniref:endonuclease/exonuclease/phosphatase family protein n=1 Tax=Spirillospora sp. CA-294931 TaxID=3240042 RepID=UPI003D93643D